MLFFHKRFHEGLRNGSVTLTFRRWETPKVKAGGKYRAHPIGVLDVEQITRTTVDAISEADARLAGFDSRDELLNYMSEASETPMEPSTEVFRVVLHHGGDGDHAPGAMDADVSDEEFERVRSKLAQLDEKSEVGPWTLRYLRLIEEQPHVVASKLAKLVERERADFKADVVKLKKLGLTQSFSVGYEVSPRGRAFLDRLTR